MTRLPIQGAAAGQTSPAQPPAPPSPPTPPPATTEVTVYRATDLAAGPMTQADVDALNAKKSELSSQLRSAQGRRDGVARDLRRASDEEKPGLQNRLQVLDARLAQLETDIAANGRALAAAPAALLAQSSTGSDGGAGFRSNDVGPFSSGQMTGISVVFILAVLMPLAVSIARTIFRRGSAPKPAPQILESAARLERMEQAIDAMAVEVERISEGQRFVTGLLAGRAEQNALQGAAEERVPVRAGAP